MTAEHTGAVMSFNQRLRDGGMSMQFPSDPVLDWLPATPGSRLYQQPHVALDGDGAVRGGYILKHQDFKIGDSVESIAHLRLPISEGIINRDYAGVALRILFDAQQRQPLLFGMGLGGYEEPIAKLLTAAGWKLFSIPFLFRVVRPARFCHRIKYLRTTWLRRLGLDLAALTGAATIGAKMVQRREPRRSNGETRYEIVPEFADWADALFERHRDQYDMLAVRDTAALRLLYPAHDSRFIRLLIADDSGPVGWCVLLDTSMSDHKQFGSLRIGSFVDSFSSTTNAYHTIAAATNYLERSGVDLIVTNQSHACWSREFRSNGYLAGPSNFLFAQSPALYQQLCELNIDREQMFLNRGDGDGPINL